MIDQARGLDWALLRRAYDIVWQAQTNFHRDPAFWRKVATAYERLSREQSDPDGRESTAERLTRVIQAMADGYERLQIVERDYDGAGRPVSPADLARRIADALAKEVR